MAFAVKYSKKFQRMGVNTTYRIDILSEAGGAVIVPDKMGAEPLTYNTLASSKDEYKIVIGSEIVFEFVLLKKNGLVNYDPLFESEYRDHIVKFYNHDTSELLWQGYLQPENIYKSVFESNVHIYLSATDALKDLSDYEFLDGTDIITDRLAGLEIIKRCLANLDTDSQFQYDFIVKLGTKHDGQGVNDTALKSVTHDCRRFFKNKSGKTEIYNCLEVIEKVLEPYSCTLKQYGGKYYIQNIYEGDTFDYTYNWTLVFQSKAAATDSVNIDTYKFSRGGELSMLAPVKEMRLKLLNRNMGDELDVDINNFGDPGGWDLTDLVLGDYVAEDGDTVLHLYLKDDNEANRTITLGGTFGLIKQTEGDYIKLAFQCKFDNLVPPFELPYFPSFKVTIIKPSGSMVTWNEPIPNYWYQWVSQNNSIFHVDETGNYNISIEFFQSDNAPAVYSEEVFVKAFSLTKISSVEGDTFTDITFDSYYKALSTKGKLLLDDKDLYFGDSIGTNDIASLVYSGANTTIWNRAGVVDELPLLHLFALNFLTSRQDYTDYLILDVKDSGDNITPLNFIEFQSKIYSIVSYLKRYRSSWVTLHLRQRFSIDATVTFTAMSLTSVDGVDNPGTTYTPSSIPVGIADWDDITGKPATFTPSAHDNTSHSVAYLAATAYTASDVLAKLITVDGAASGLDADLLDGQHGSYYAPIDSPIFTTKITTPIVYGSSAANGDVVIEGTLHATKDTSYVLIQPNGGFTGVGISTPLVHLHIKALDTVTGKIRIQGGKDTVTSVGEVNSALEFGSNDASVTGGIGGKIESVTEFSNGAYVGMAFSTYFQGRATELLEAVRIDTLGSIKEPNFVTGWSGTNWQISLEGDAEFNNLIVRGSARFRELIIDQLSVIGGSDLMSIARGKVLSVDTVNSKVTLEDPNGRGTSAFAVNDFFWIKNVDIDHNLFSDIRGQITGITGVTLTLDLTVAGANGAIGDIAEGDVIVQRGHPTDTDRQSLIYRTASDANNPFQRYLSGVDSLAAFDDLANIILQEGNLESLAGHGIVPVSPGVGIYSKNAYLSGTLYSSEVSVSGLLSNTVIKGPDIWEDAYNGSSNLYINRLGYQGGATQFRQTVIGDGKGNDIATFGGLATGSFITLDASVFITGALRFAGSDSLSYAFEKTPSNNLRNSHDAEVSTLSDTYFKVKTITLTKGLLGATRINFSMKWVDNAGNGTTAYGRLYRDDNLGGPLQAIGVEQSTVSTNYVLMTQDITQIWLPGDKLELWIHTNDDMFQDQVTINNFRILYDDLPIVAVPSTNS